MGKHKIKQPKLQQGKQIKTPETIEIEAFDHPIFCFKHLHNKYSVASCSDEQKKALITKLDQLSRLTWEQIKQAPRHGLGTEKITRDSIKHTIPAFVTADVDHLLALRFDGKKPILIHRNRFIMHLIFIDHDFSVYKHSK